MLIVFAIVAAAAACFDVRSRTIPNGLNAGLAIAGLAIAGIGAGWEAAGSALAHFGIALAIGLGAYSLGLWGGGDAKFYAATAAWFGLEDFPRLIVSISLAGLVLVLGWFGTRRLWKPASTDRNDRELPYGVAIAVGAIAAMAMQRF